MQTTGTTDSPRYLADSLRTPTCTFVFFVFIKAPALRSIDLRSSICMRPGCHAQLPNNCLFHFVCLFRFVSWGVSLLPNTVFSIITFSLFCIHTESTVISSEFAPRGDVYFFRKTITPGVTQRLGVDLKKKKHPGGKSPRGNLFSAIIDPT